MLVCIHQPNYLPRAKVIDKMLTADLMIYLDDVQYVPREWQNRALVRGPGGNAHWLSVPVFTKGKSRPAIQQCQVVDSPVWRRKHPQTIRQAYASSPWIQLFEDKVAPLWSQSVLDLTSLCIGSTERLLGMLGQSVRAVRLLELEQHEGLAQPEQSARPELQESGQATAGDDDVALIRRTARLVQLCKAVGATGYLTGSGGVSYLQIDQFKGAGIKVFLQRDPEAELGAWRQMSTLDSILTKGPDATIGNLLRGSYDEL